MSEQTYVSGLPVVFNDDLSAFRGDVCPDMVLVGGESYTLSLSQSIREAVEDELREQYPEVIRGDFVLCMGDLLPREITTQYVQNVVDWCADMAGDRECSRDNHVWEVISPPLSYKDCPEWGPLPGTKRCVRCGRKEPDLR